MKINSETQSGELSLDYWTLSQFHEYENNPRQNDHVIEMMIAAIEEFGFKIPILAQSDGLVIDGHLRLKAARQLGLETIPVVIADDLTDTQVKAFRILANQSANWADWDMDLLGEEVRSLEKLDFDVDLIGFSDEMLNGLLEAPALIDGETIDESIPETQDEVIARAGDLWILGEHKLLCGDATQLEDVQKLLGDELVDMTFTDPPYNVDYANSAKDKLRGKDRPILNDNLGSGFYQFLYDAMVNILLVTKGACYVAMSSSELDTLQKAFREAGGKWSTFIIWAKNHFTMGRADYQRQYEPILYGWKNGNDHYWCGDRSQGDVWFFKKPHKSDLHPTMKPVELVEQAIRNSSKTKDIVFDPFGGSGTTLMACERTNRKARLIELDPKYVDVIVRRWQQHTNDKARLAQTDECFDLLASGIRKTAQD